MFVHFLLGKALVDAAFLRAIPETSKFKGCFVLTSFLYLLFWHFSWMWLFCWLLQRQITLLILIYTSAMSLCYHLTCTPQKLNSDSDSELHVVEMASLSTVIGPLGHNMVQNKSSMNVKYCSVVKLAEESECSVNCI